MLPAALELGVPDVDAPEAASTVDSGSWLLEMPNVVALAVVAAVAVGAARTAVPIAEVVAASALAVGPLLADVVRTPLSNLDPMIVAAGPVSVDAARRADLAVSST